jgi:hypothetical protein
MMKRFLLSILAIGILFPAIAQNDLKMNNAIPLEGKQHVKKTPAPVNNSTLPMSGIRSVVDQEYIDPYIEVKSSYTKMGNLPIINRYDMHTQGALYDMMYVHKDGFVGAVWTVSTENVTDVAERDIAYAYSRDNGQTWNEEIEYPVVGRHGYWPSYVPWGEDGELIMLRLGNVDVSHHDGLTIYRRAKKGEGDWEVFDIPNIEGGRFVWHRCCVTGENNQYLHVVVCLTDVSNYQGYTSSPLVYNRSSDGGKTWDFEWTVVPNLSGSTWAEDFYYAESASWAKPQGSNLALLCAGLGDGATILKSTNHGEPGSWTEIPVWDCSMDMHPGPDQKVDTGYRSASGACVAFDNNGKLHAVMNSTYASPSTTQEGYYSYYYGFPSLSALVYWNEDRGVYTFDDMNQIIYQWAYNGFYWVWEEEDGYYGYFDKVSGEFNDYVIGGPVPLLDEVGSEMEDGKWMYNFKWVQAEGTLEWLKQIYNGVGVWPYPQIIFDHTNRLHMVYLSLLDGASDGDYQRYHVFHTSTKDEFKTYSSHTDLNNFMAIKNSEFSYLYLGGFTDVNKLLYMVQTDSKSGTYVSANDHGPTENDMYAFNVDITNVNIDDAENFSVPMNVYPNPASNQVTVQFNGICNIELYNMVGQKIYSAENVYEKHNISIEGLTSGVYFVTVRDGKRMTTQKLIVQ